MSRNTKIILAIVAGALVLLAVCACVTVLVATLLLRNASVSVSPSRVETVEEAVQVQPGQGETADGQIANFTLPAGWQHDYSVRVAGFRLVGYKPESGTGHIVLAVLPETPGKSIDEMERELRGLIDVPGYKGNRMDMTIVERRQTTVKRQATEMIISENTRAGDAWRQAVTSFRGDQGLTLVMYGMPATAYSQADADALFASIR